MTDSVGILVRRTLFSFLLFFVALSSQNSFHVAGSGGQTDRLALLDVKAAITDDPHGSLASWNGSLPVCRWTGVACNTNDRVTALTLDSMSLQGTISPSIGNLTFLTTLYLSSNSFQGAIPAEVGRLSRLESLNLSYNSLTGAIPANLSSCTSLLSINLTHNLLTSTIPVELMQLSSLHRLKLSYNNLYGVIPPSLGGMRSLYYIDLSSNKLTGNIPSSLGELTSLVHLDLSQNSLGGVIPPSLTNLSSLSILGMYENNLQGPLPKDLGRLQNLTYLSATTNNLSGAIPPSLYTITSLQVLAIGNNSLSGTLPPNIGLKLPHLLQLNLYLNQIEGTIPVSLANASGLQLIDLSYNQFRGKIPAIFGSLPYLNWLALENNNFEASETSSDWAFLSSLANCSQLQNLFLNNNDLGGELPSSITNLSTQLTFLTVGVNPRLGGAIPQGINNLVNLNTLEFQQCNFTGIIPDSITQLPKLQALVLWGNKLSGTIPSSIGNITQLNELFLDRNELHGDIPVSFAYCQNLNILDLSSNKLSGQIPSEVLSLTSLSIYLNLSYNYLSGQLPPNVGNLQSLGIMDFSNNRLFGGIPGSIGECQLLEQLSLSHNLFEGNIPSTMASLRGLKILDLSHNNLSGSLPSFLGDLPYLQLLNLSFNDLDGEVPTEGVFDNASAVGVIGNYHLCGGITQLHLPSCSIQKHHGSHSFVVKIVVPIACGILLLGLSISCYLVRRSRKRPSMAAPSENSCWKISYVELVKATDNFSTYNLIGVGTFGSVFKGALNHGETIAVKVLDLQQQGAFKSFMAECETLSKIRHRNLIKILTVCTSVDSNGDEFRALVFEFMENGSLEDWLHPKKDAKISTRSLSLAERLDIAINVAAALKYLHNDHVIPIVHCDLKPSNVLLDSNMNARVGDFGLARFLQTSSGQASTGASSSLAVKGTIGYVPPEYGTGGQVSTQGDVYSYGILLLELITGRRPTDGMFKDGYSLPMFVEKKLSTGTHVSLIADPSLFPEVSEETMLDVEGGNNHRSGMDRCLVLVLKVGLSCSREQPGDRMKMKDAVTQLLAIRGFLLSRI